MSCKSNRPLLALSRSAVIAFVAGSGGWSSAAAQQTSSNQFHEAALVRWLESSGLSKIWEFQTPLHRSLHPSANRDVPTLELLFRPPSPNGEQQERRQFEEFLGRYRAQSGVSFPDKVFYKFIETYELPRQDAAVVLHVAVDDVEIFVDPATDLLVCRHAKGRAVREFEVVLPATPMQTRALQGKVAVGNAAYDPAKTVRDFLEDRFRKANVKAKLPEPRITPFACDSHHVGLSVSGLRGQVFPDAGAWEEVTINIDLFQEPGGLFLTAYTDGFYAGGAPWGRLPSDYPSSIEHDHPKELGDFSHKLFDDVKKALMKGTP